MRQEWILMTAGVKIKKHFNLILYIREIRESYTSNMCGFGGLGHHVDGGPVGWLLPLQAAAGRPACRPPELSDLLQDSSQQTDELRHPLPTLTAGTNEHTHTPVPAVKKGLC